jgi:hypothetical protein
MQSLRIFGMVSLLGLLLVAGSDALAQGFPGGGGGRGGHGMHGPPSGAKSPNAGSPATAADPLTTFFGTLHTLRMELLVREDQVEKWTAMQDALRAYVDLAQDTATEQRNAADPFVRVRDLADGAHARADALQKISDSLAALLGVLDDRQRQVFVARLGDAFAGGTQRAP